MTDFQRDLARETAEAIGLVEEAYRGAALDLVGAVTTGNEYSTGTPVDTGFARSSWRIGVNGDGQGTSLALQALTVNDTVHITGGAEYLPFLESGETTPRNPATPSGWVARAVAAWDRMVVTRFERIAARNRRLR